MYELIMDTESQALPSNMPKKTGFVQAWKVPLPLRRNHVLSDILTIAFCLTLAACVMMLPCLLLPLTSVGTDALVKSITSRSSTRVRFAFRTTISTTCSTSLLREIVLLYGTMPIRLFSMMPIRCQYIRTMTILVASHFSKRWLRGVLVSKLMYTLSEVTFWLDTRRKVYTRRTTCGQCT
jgi:hypothetical protein